MSTRVLSNLPPLPRPALPVVQHHRVETPAWGLHVTEWPAPDNARHAVMLLPGAGGHAGSYGVLAAELRARGVHVLGVDPPGHGRSEGPRGGVDLLPMVRSISAAAGWAAHHTGLPVCLLGVSMGCQWALHSHLLSPHVRATICHALQLPTLAPLDLRVRLMQSRLAFRLSSWFPEQPVHLDAAAHGQRAADPLVLRSYRLATWQSFFTTAPAWPPGSNHKPVLVVVGERDEVVPPAHALRCYMALGGPKAFHVVAGAAHHLASENAPALADAAVDFLDALPV